MAKKNSLIILFLFTGAASINAILISPSLPFMSNYFPIKAHQSTLIITIFLLGYAISQLIYGPISNSYGRKKSLKISVIVGIIGTLICISSPLTHLFIILLIGRFISAIGIAGGLTVGMTILSDEYKKVEMAKAFSIIVLGVAVTPGIAITTGAFLVATFGWISCYIALLIYNIMLLILILKIKETFPLEKRCAFNFKTISLNSFKALKNKVTITLSIVFGGAAAIIYIFASASPFIGIHLLHLSPVNYGLLYFTFTIGYVFGTIITNKLTNFMKFKNIATLGIIIIAIGLLLYGFFSFFHIYSVLTYFLPGTIIFTGLPLIYIIATTLVLDHTNDSSNTSSIMNFICIFLAFGGTLLISLTTITFSSISIIILITFIIIIIFFVLGVKNINYKNTKMSNFSNVKPMKTLLKN